MPHRVVGPRCGLVRVARGARIGNFIFVRHRRRDECERVRAHVDARNRHFDFRHVTGDAFTAR